MHRRPHKKDEAATKAAYFLSRYSYVSHRIHPNSKPPHQCVYLAGDDCGVVRAAIFDASDSKCQDCGKVMPLDGDLTVRGHLAHGGNTKVSRCWCPENLKLKCYVCHMLKEHGREPRWSIGINPEVAL